MPVAPDHANAMKAYYHGTHRTTAPESTTAGLRPLLTAFGITRVANLTGLDRTGIPVVMVCRPDARSSAVFHGKGIDIAAAKASGLMEAIETWHAEHVQLPLCFGSHNELNTVHRLINVASLPRARRRRAGRARRCGFAELGFAYLYEKRHEESLAEYARALALNPKDADIIAEYADALVYTGQPERSVELLEKAMRLNPYYPDWYLWYLADAYGAMGRPADVIATVHRMQSPDEGRRLLAASFADLGMMDEAREQAQEVLRLHPEFTLSRWRGRPPFRDSAILERYIDSLRKAGLPD